MQGGRVWEIPTLECRQETVLSQKTDEVSSVTVGMLTKFGDIVLELKNRYRGICYIAFLSMRNMTRVALL